MLFTQHQSLLIPAPLTPPAPSRAVLPVTNLGWDQGQDCFSDGLSDELLNSLHRINELQVAARTSSFYFKGELADLATIAHKLNVASILEGSVRRMGNKIRVSAQLIHVANGYQLWADKYDREMDDVFAIQDEIAQNIVKALRVVLSDEEKKAIETVKTGNGEEYG